jgi:hypothetical protein
VAWAAWAAWTCNCRSAKSKTLLFAGLASGKSPAKPIDFPVRTQRKGSRETAGLFVLAAAATGACGTTARFSRWKVSKHRLNPATGRLMLADAGHDGSPLGE